MEDFHVTRRGQAAIPNSPENSSENYIHYSPLCTFSMDGTPILTAVAAGHVTITEEDACADVIAFANALPLGRCFGRIRERVTGESHGGHASHNFRLGVWIDAGEYGAMLLPSPCRAAA
jgi:hypothetical protein